MVTESLEWVDRLKGYTKRLAGAVALACRELRNVKSVAEQFALAWGTVKDIDKAALAKDLPSPSEASPRIIGVDEFSIKKGHRYGTTVVDFERKEIPYIAEDRTKESLANFYKALGEDKRRV